MGDFAGGGGAAGGASSAGGIGGAMGGLGTIFSLMGNMSAGSAAAGQGERARAEAEFEAAQLRQQAHVSIASGQRDAAEQHRRARLVASRAMALAAASGGGASDPTVVNLLADIEGEGAYRAGVALYQGEEKARQLRMGADAKVYEGEVSAQGGKDKRSAYNMLGFGQGATGVASLFGKYGQGGAKSFNSAASSGSWIDAGSAGFGAIG